MVQLLVNWNADFWQLTMLITLDRVIEGYVDNISLFSKVIKVVNIEI